MAAFALLAAPSSGAAPLGCGDAVKKSTELTRDVTGCRGVGLRIGADRIVLDLNGHTVSAAAQRNPKAHGIFNDGHEKVTIRNGTVTGFGAYGVRIADADRNRVEQMQLNGNFTGVGLVQSDRGLVRDNQIGDQRFVGVNLTGGKANRVTGNTITGSRGGGIFIHGSAAEQGRRHNVVSNGLTGNGVEVHPGTRGTTLLGNTIVGAPSDGIAVFEPATTLTGNAVWDNLGHGIDALNGATDGGGNRAAGNNLEPQCVGITCASG